MRYTSLAMSALALFALAAVACGGENSSNPPGASGEAGTQNSGSGGSGTGGGGIDNPTGTGGFTGGTSARFVLLGKEPDADSLLIALIATAMTARTATVSQIILPETPPEGLGV